MLWIRHTTISAIALNYQKMAASFKNSGVESIAAIRCGGLHSYHAHRPHHPLRPRTSQRQLAHRCALGALPARGGPHGADTGGMGWPRRRPARASGFQDGGDLSIRTRYSPPALATAYLRRASDRPPAHGKGSLPGG